MMKKMGRTVKKWTESHVFPWHQSRGASLLPQYITDQRTSQPYDEIFLALS